MIAVYLKGGNLRAPSLSCRIMGGGGALFQFPAMLLVRLQFFWLCVSHMLVISSAAAPKLTTLLLRLRSCGFEW